MDGVPVAQRKEQLRYGVAAVNLRSGQIVALLEFQTAVDEIFDVQLMRGLRFPEVIGFQHETIQHTFVVPHIPSDPPDALAISFHASACHAPSRHAAIVASGSRAPLYPLDFTPTRRSTSKACNRFDADRANG
jgi:hypothetical protein